MRRGETARKGVELKKKDQEKKIDITSTFQKIADKLAYIEQHFDDVQSFWSKGHSDECQKMMTQLKSTKESLADPSVSTSIK